ncbi:MAG: hypothetical protein V4503_09835 [Gemmatimonadota bacterium]
MVSSILAVLAGFAFMVVLVMVTTPLLAKLFLEGGMRGSLTTSYLAGNLTMAGVAALGGGCLTARLAHQEPLLHGIALAGLMLVMSLLSMRQSTSAGQPRWYALTLATVMPVLTLGGAYFCSRASG